MPFTPFAIPNDPGVGDPLRGLSQVDKVDLDIVIAGFAGHGVTSGCGVTTTGAANGSVAVEAGEASISWEEVNVIADTALEIAANSSGNIRYDLISVGVAGTPTVTQGTPSADPKLPALPTDHAALAMVHVPNGHTATTVIPANSIAARAIPIRSQLLTDKRGGEDFEVLLKQKSTARVPFTVKALNHLGTVLQAKDFLDAPIWWVLTTGGMYCNDTIRTTRTVFGPDNFVADIYGYLWRGDQASFVFDGPPGNMLSHRNACHENFQGDRAATLGDWSAVAGGTIATAQLAPPYNTYPTRLNTVIRMTNTSGSAVWIATLGGAFAISGVTAGQVYSGIANVRFQTAAAARTCTIRMQFYNDAGTQQGSDVNSSAISVPNSGTGWTQIPINGTIAPANATKVQIHVLMNSANGEVHDVMGVGIMKDQQLGVFAPPFVAQNADGTPATTEGIGVAGAQWIRTDKPRTPGKRMYMMTTGGAPNLQVWESLDAPTLYRLERDVISTITTAAAVPEFALLADANETYVCTYDLFIRSAALTTGWQLGFTGPGSPGNFYAICTYDSSATATLQAKIQSLTTFPLVTAAYAIAPNIIRIQITARLNNGVNAGTLNLTWRSEVAGSAVTITKGSTLSVA